MHDILSMQCTQLFHMYRNPESGSEHSIALAQCRIGCEYELWYNNIVGVKNDWCMGR